MSPVVSLMLYGTNYMYLPLSCEISRIKFHVYCKTRNIAISKVLLGKNVFLSDSVDQDQTARFVQSYLDLHTVR